MKMRMIIIIVSTQLIMILIIVQYHFTSRNAIPQCEVISVTNCYTFVTFCDTPVHNCMI